MVINEELNVGFILLINKAQTSMSLSVCEAYYLTVNIKKIDYIKSV